MLFAKGSECIQLPLPGFETLHAKCPLPTILAPSLLGLHANGWACMAFLLCLHFPKRSYFKSPLPLLQEEVFPPLSFP